jgi:hypothetical protein
MKCTEFENLIDEYVDNELTHSLELVEEHINNCESCRDLYEERIELKELLGGLEMIDLPDDFEATLHEKLVIASNDNVTPIKRFNKQIKWIGSIAALAIVSVSVYNALPNNGRDLMDTNIASMEMTADESYATDDMDESDIVESVAVEEVALEVMETEESTEVNLTATYADASAKSIRMVNSLPVSSGITYYLNGDREAIESFILEWNFEGLEFLSYQYQFYIETDMIETFNASLKESFVVSDEITFDYQSMLDEAFYLHSESEDTLRYLEQKYNEAKEEDKEDLKIKIETEKNILETYRMELKAIEYYRDYQQIIIIMNEE